MPRARWSRYPPPRIRPETSPGLRGPPASSSWNASASASPPARRWRCTAGGCTEATAAAPGRCAPSAFHRLEELCVGLGVLQFGEQEFHGGELVHRMKHLAQHPRLLQLVRIGQILSLAGAGAVDVYCVEYALLRDAT